MAGERCVIKLGGSLGEAPELRQWLQQIVAHGAGRIVVVPGGGCFADQVREAQARWGLSEATAHEMALLAMAQFGLALRSLCPVLRVACTPAAAQAILRSGEVALWLPLGGLLAQPEAVEASWRVTSDSLSVWLAAQIDARQLLLVKSCTIPSPPHLPEELVRAGIVDAAFADYVGDSRLSFALAHKSEAAMLERWLDASS